MKSAMQLLEAVGQIQDDYITLTSNPNFSIYHMLQIQEYQYVLGKTYSGRYKSSICYCNYV